MFLMFLMWLMLLIILRRFIRVAGRRIEGEKGERWSERMGEGDVGGKELYIMGCVYFSEY